MITQLSPDILENGIFLYLYELHLFNFMMVNKDMYQRLKAIRILKKLKIESVWPHLQLYPHSDHFIFSNDPSIPQLLDEFASLQPYFPFVTVYSTVFPLVYKYLKQLSIGKLTLNILVQKDYSELAGGLSSNIVSEISFQSYEGIGDTQFEQIMSHIGKMKKLRTVEFCCDLHTPGTSRVLQEYLPLSSISTLKMERNSINSECISIIASALPHTSITNIDLFQNYIDDEGIVALANVLPQTKIEVLDLNRNEFGKKGIEALSSGLIGSNVKILGLPPLGNDIIALIKVLPLLPLESFSYYDQLDDEIEELLIKNITKTKLKKISCEISTKSFAGYFESLHTLKIKEFDFLTKDGDEICDIISKHPQFISHCTEFNLWNAKATPIGMQKLMPIIAGSDIEKLSLSHNQLGDEGLEIIAKYLPLTKIKKLMLRNCGNGDQGLIAISNCLKDTQIVYLELCALDVTNIGIQHILSRLGKLKFLNISRGFAMGSQPTVIDQEKVQQIIKDNPHMRINCSNYK
ncbi:hypothetical protein HDV01_003529 [Terramyces sp. JEL0728]|nr:hypothetical protein HDV01_003529 [Terramyces sp. JEL0728]